MSRASETARPEGFAFPRRMRLTLAKDFAQLRRTPLRRLVGPLVVSAAANDRSHCRLGLAVSRRVGTAAARNTIKRRIREAFRLQQHSLPAAYDLLVSVRPHEPLPQKQYLNLLAEAANALHKSWIRQQKKSREDQRE